MLARRINRERSRQIEKTLSSAFLKNVLLPWLRDISVRDQNTCGEWEGYERKSDTNLS